MGFGPMFVLKLFRKQEKSPAISKTKYLHDDIFSKLVYNKIKDVNNFREKQDPEHSNAIKQKIIFLIKYKNEKNEKKQFAFLEDFDNCKFIGFFGDDDRFIRKRQLYQAGSREGQGAAAKNFQ